MTRPDASEIFSRFEKKRGPRSRGAFALALIAHAIVIFALASIAFHYPIRDLLQIRTHDKAVERIQYIHVAPSAGAAPAGPANRDSAAPARPAARPPRADAPPADAPQAPTTVPTELPPTSSGSGGNAGVPGGTGTGGGGVATGVTPGGDPRLWAAPGPVVPRIKTSAERADSVVRAVFGDYVDSVRIEESARGRAPGDWTVEKGGQKWGVDQKWVHLGKVKIPTAVLALLPLNTQGNPTEIDRRRTQAYQRQDILFQAARAVNEDEFRQAVKRIRERKERERRQALADRSRSEGDAPATP